MAKLNPSLERRNEIISKPSSWELFLLGTGVAEKDCTSLFATHSREGQSIRSWVREHYATRYVPEHVLEALGLRRQLMRQWQGDD
jgi:hypothetical protein